MSQVYKTDARPRPLWSQSYDRPTFNAVSLHAGAERIMAVTRTLMYYVSVHL